MEKLEPRTSLRDVGVRNLSKEIVKILRNNDSFAAFRMLWEAKKIQVNELVEKRTIAQRILTSLDEVTISIDSFTCLRKVKKIYVGFAFWIAVNGSRRLDVSTRSENDHTFGPKIDFQNRTLTVQI